MYRTPVRFTRSEISANFCGVGSASGEMPSIATIVRLYRPDRYPNASWATTIVCWVQVARPAVNVELSVSKDAFSEAALAAYTEAPAGSLWPRADATLS